MNSSYAWYNFYSICQGIFPCTPSKWCIVSYHCWIRLLLFYSCCFFLSVWLVGVFFVGVVLMDTDAIDVNLLPFLLYWRMNMVVSSGFDSPIGQYNSLGSVVSLWVPPGLSTQQCLWFVFSDGEVALGHCGRLARKQELIMGHFLGVVSLIKD